MFAVQKMLDHTHAVLLISYDVLDMTDLYACYLFNWDLPDNNTLRMAWLDLSLICKKKQHTIGQKNLHSDFCSNVCMFH